jgi:hypothetical protein
VTRSGIRTSEFWATLASQFLALLALAGVVSAADAATLQDAVVKCVTAAGVFAANAWVIVRYIQSRTRLKELMR